MPPDELPSIVTPAGPASDPAVNFDTYIPFGLTAIANKISRSASRTYLALFGIGINEWRILANLRARPGTTANAICQHSGLDKAAVSRSLRLLEDNRMIETSPGSPESRGRNLRLTKAGDELHDQVIMVALAREARLLTGFTPEERVQFRYFITRLHANVSLVTGENEGVLLD